MDDLIRAKRVVKEVAESYGISEKEVVTEIEFAISDAILTSYRQQNRTVLEMWNKIPRSSVIPSAYEVIAYFGSERKQWREMSEERGG